MTRTRSLLVPLAAVALLTGCGGGDEGASGSIADVGVVASVASYELEAASPQRFLVGLVTNDQELLGYGTASLTFTYAGTKDRPVTDGKLRGRGIATYRLIPGQKASGDADTTRVVGFDKGAGVYGVDKVTFPEAGYWNLRATVRLGGELRTAQTTFEVLEDSTVVEIGDPAPRTVNHLPGTEGVPPDAIDSRAEDADVPDPSLHAGTIADALAAGRPLAVVVSTPVYCVSRFCGPITDSVEQLAARYGDRMAFVHLEVWRDFEGKAINKAAAEWILPASGAAGGREPWVFLVGRDGLVSHRFDNVVSDRELQAAVEDVLA